MSEEATLLSNPVKDYSAVSDSDTPAASAPPAAAAAAAEPAAAPVVVADAYQASSAAADESKEPLAAVPLASAAAAAVEAVAAVVPAVPIVISMPNIKLTPYEFSFNVPFTLRVMEFKVVEPTEGGGKPIVFYRVAHFPGATYPEWIPPVVPEPIILPDGTPHFEDVELWPAPETPEKPELATAVDWRWKRYSEFEAIYTKLHTYPGAIRLPHIPPKTYNPFQSPADALLLSTRLLELDQYIYALSAWLSLPNTNGFTKMHLDQWLRTDVGVEAEARFQQMTGNSGQEKEVAVVEVPEKEDNMAAFQSVACDVVDAAADATCEVVADASAQLAGKATTAVAGKTAGAAAKKVVKKTVTAASKGAKNAVMPQHQSAGASGQATGSSGGYPGPSRAAVAPAPAPAPVPVKVLTVAEKLEIAAKAKADAQAANDAFLQSLSPEEKEKHLAQVELIKRLKSFEGFAFMNSFTGFCEHWRFEVAFSTITRQFAARVIRRVMCSSAPNSQRSKTTFECLVSVDSKEKFVEMELRAPGAPSANNKTYYVRIHVPETEAQARTVDPNANSLEDGPAAAVSSPTPETPASPSAGKRSIKIDFTDEYFFLGLRGNSLPSRALTSFEEEQAEMQRQLTEGTGVYTRKLVETSPPAAIALM